MDREHKLSDKEIVKCEAHKELQSVAQLDSKEDEKKYLSMPMDKTTTPCDLDQVENKVIICSVDYSRYLSRGWHFNIILYSDLCPQSR